MKEEKKVKIRVTNAFNVGYAAGRIYEVSPEEAAKLIGDKKAVPVTEPQTETAQIKVKGKEKR